MSMVKAGWAKRCITPATGISLEGYLNPRPNKGKYDDLFVRVLLLEQNDTVCGFVTFDLCAIPAQMCAALVDACRKEGIDFAENLIFSATHTHTGPTLGGIFGFESDKGFDDELAAALEAIKEARANMVPAELTVNTAESNFLAFNRRFYMKNGKVMTNPAKNDPEIVAPEGPVDRQITVVGICCNGEYKALLVNLINHTDTVGGSLVSADWPGRMEEALQRLIAPELQVHTLIGCSGNINHFDHSIPGDQTSIDEALRIGEKYADCVMDLLKEPKDLSFDQIKISSIVQSVEKHTVTEAECVEARAVLERNANAGPANGDMTSRELAAGYGPVAVFFAEQLLGFAKSESGTSQDVRILDVQFGNEMEFVTLPGEPFTEIGLEIKQNSSCKGCCVISLAMGEVGYVALEECYNRGGYEILPVMGGGPAHDTAAKFLKAVKALRIQ